MNKTAMKIVRMSHATFGGSLLSLCFVIGRYLTLENNRVERPSTLITADHFSKSYVLIRKRCHQLSNIVSFDLELKFGYDTCLKQVGFEFLVNKQPNCDHF